MNTKHRALLWEELRVGGPIAAVCLLAGLMMQGSLFIQFEGWHRVDKLVMMVTIGVPMMVGLLLILNVANTGHLKGGFSRRILNLPVETGSTVAIVLLTRLLLVLTVSALMIGMCHVVFRHGPVATTILALAGIYLLVQVLDWSRAVTLVVIPIVACLGLVGYRAIQTGVLTQRELPVLFLVGAILAIPLSFGLSYFFVQSARRGERLGQRTVHLPNVRVAKMISRIRPARPFSSPVAALTWWELKQIGWLFPGLVAIFWGLFCSVLWLDDLSKHGIPDYIFPVSSEPWVYLEVLPFLALIPAAFGWGLYALKLWKHQERSFLMRQPVHKLQRAQAHLLATGISLGVCLGVITLVSTLSFLYLDNGLVARMFSDLIERGEISWREVAVILFAPPFVVGLILWCIVANTGLVVLRKRRLPVVILMAAAYCALVTGLFTYGYQTYGFSIGEAILPGVVGMVLLVLSMIVYLFARRTIMAWRAGLLTSRALVVSAGAFVWLTLSLFPFSLPTGPQATQHAGIYIPIFLLGSLSLAATAVLPFPSMALALHRAGHEGAIEEEKRPRTVGRWPMSFTLSVLIAILATVWVKWPAEAAWKEAWRSRGLPSSLEEVDAWYPAVPESENVSTRYLGASWQQRVGELNWHYSRPTDQDILVIGHADVRRWEQIPENVWQTSKAYWDATCPEVSRTLHQVAASGLTSSRYPIDLRQGFMVDLPHLSKLRQLARVLSLESYLDVLQGRYAEAADAMADIIPIANSLEDEPVVISQLVRVAILGIAVAVLEDPVMNRGQLSEEDLERLQEVLATALPPIENERIFDRALIVETLFISELEESFALEEVGLLMACAVPVADATGFSRFNEALGIYTMQLYMAEAKQTAEDNAISDKRMLMRDSLAEYVNPTEDLLSSDHLLFRAPFAAQVVPALSRIYLSEWRLRTSLDLARTAIAVERFRLAQGRLPETLEELTPTYLDAIPPDYFNEGRPLSYRVKENGEFVVYSYGQNHRDDNGNEMSREDKGMPTDITFTVAPPEMREWLRQIGPAEVTDK